MDLQLKGKVAVVTGGTSGIGLASVQAFLNEGSKVAFCARNEERLDSVHRELSHEFGADQVLSHKASVLDSGAMFEFAKTISAHFGNIDILVNNAGQGRVSTFSETSDEDWREELDLKFFSQIYPIRAFQKMLEKSNSGSIIGVNSLLAYQPEPHMVCTSAARAGVQNLLKSLATELAPKIRVNSILLGIVVSGQWERRFESREDKSLGRNAWFADQAASKNIPLGRFGDAQEVANAIVYLSSPIASYITGTGLEISGGVSRFI
jgi:NAD(P)-dependent dehydrogenase (short-subunit alcohol dehydrogenase family)